tara:strand:- start:32121 stop:32705 length:585 start_codon:yes stop_codon:yes gene_type:complete
MKLNKLKTNKGQSINGIALINSDIFEDERGLFFESWNKKKFDENLELNINFCQDNHSRSHKGVLRGLHYQTSPKAQGKLIRCICGRIFDVAVDIRKDSKTFGQWVGVELNEENKNQLWMSEGFAHGFLTLSKKADVLYKTTEYWSKANERSILWNDKYLDIKWPLESISIQNPILSPKDAEASSFSQIEEFREI